MAKVNPAWLIKKHPGDLKAQIRDAVAFGFSPASQDATTAHLVRKKKFSCLFCLITGLIPYFIWYMAKRDNEIYLDTSIQPKGKELEAYVAKEEEKKRRNTTILIGFLIFIFVVLPILSFIGAAFSSSDTSDVSSERPGEQAVYERIVGLTDCDALQQEFDLAEAHGERNRQDGKMDLARISTSYMEAADMQMQKIGCNR